MTRFTCKRGCKSFGTNSPMQMIKHNILEHNAKYSTKTIKKQQCNDHNLKEEVMKLAMKNEIL